MKTIIQLLLLLAPAVVFPQLTFEPFSPAGCIWQTVGNQGFSAGTINYTSLAIQPVSEQPYVAYVDIPAGPGNVGPATVMRFDGSNWVNVGNAGFTTVDVGYPSLAFGPGGVPYLAYGATCTAPNQATVMKFVENSWFPVGIGGFSDGQTAFTSLAFSPAGQPYVAFMDMANSNKTTVMKFDGTNWVNTGNQGFTGGYITFTSLAVSPSGIPFVAYQDYMNSDKATVMKYDFPVGLNENQARGPVCYPNPATTVLHVNLSNIPCEKKVIEIYNMQGQMVSFFHTSADKFTLNTQDYPVGIYTLTIRTKNSNDITRFCKY